ncbi:gonadotropin subunit beta-1-like [Poeciliopsis prolifica]|uniref:gonadotropin subunit beta-1-like n=1 Tax=Poeciliopsis prolifica TaxID=188132 RepID=UPI00241367A1|nr:gonadotropin subunit beta-1-like [Poeciliopsis prolifica]XP_054907528.1 gonadotropin subunit beta-1-like [Poeciliopsis prolifica]
MKLAVLVVVLVLGKGCFSCNLKNVSILMKRCDQEVCIHTTICEGLCYFQDPVFEDPEVAPVQTICKGDWSYEVQDIDIEGCPGSITYPVATNCDCSRCNTEDTDCGRFYGDIPNC